MRHRSCRATSALPDSSDGRDKGAAAADADADADEVSICSGAPAAEGEERIMGAPFTQAVPEEY